MKTPVNDRRSTGDALCGQTVKLMYLDACRFDLDRSEGKSSQVNGSARNSLPEDLRVLVTAFGREFYMTK